MPTGEHSQKSALIYQTRVDLSNPVVSSSWGAGPNASISPLYIYGKRFCLVSFCRKWIGTAEETEREMWRKLFHTNPLRGSIRIPRSEMYKKKRKRKRKEKNQRRNLRFRSTISSSSSSSFPFSYTINIWPVLHLFCFFTESKWRTLSSLMYIYLCETVYIKEK